MPAETEGTRHKFPAKELRAGYGAIWQGRKFWNGVAILGKGREPLLTRRRVSGDSDDTHRRYIEAAINGLASGCLYVPKCNPAPGPTFNAGVDKHVWGWEHTSDHAPVWLALSDD